MARILYFSTTWCGPCKMFKPVVQEAMAETGVLVSFLDAEQSSDLAAKYEIRSVPTIVVEQDGVVITRKTGVMSKPQVVQLLNSFR